VKVNYCIGTSVGKSGKVLRWDPMPSENEEALQAHFTALFAQMEEPPYAIFLDDVGKWKKCVHACAVARWGSVAADKILFGLDVMHWRNILLRCADNHHMDYSALERGLKLIVGRILGYCQHGHGEQLPGPFETALEIRSAVRRLYETHCGRRIGRGRLPQGNKFVTAAEYDLCAALGQCIDDESKSKKVRLDFDVTEALGLHERGILSKGLAEEVWKMMLAKDEEYWESLLVRTKVWMKVRRMLADRKKHASASA
jgi:hypothetical protein